MQAQPERLSGSTHDRRFTPLGVRHLGNATWGPPLGTLYVLYQNMAYLSFNRKSWTVPSGGWRYAHSANWGSSPQSLATVFIIIFVFPSPRPLPRKGAGRWKYENDNKNSGKRLWSSHRHRRTASLFPKHNSFPKWWVTRSATLGAPHRDWHLGSFIYIISKTCHITVID